LEKERTKKAKESNTQNKRTDEQTNKRTNEQTNKFVKGKGGLGEEKVASIFNCELTGAQVK